jgi:hypothetical protein
MSRQTLVLHGDRLDIDPIVSALKVAATRRDLAKEVSFGVKFHGDAWSLVVTNYSGSSKKIKPKGKVTHYLASRPLGDRALGSGMLKLNS